MIDDFEILKKMITCLIMHYFFFVIKKMNSTSSKFKIIDRHFIFENHDFD